MIKYESNRIEKMLEALIERTQAGVELTERAQAGITFTERTQGGVELGVLFALFWRSFRTEIMNRMDSLDNRLDRLAKDQKHMGKSLRAEVGKRLTQMKWAMNSWGGVIIAAFILAVILNKII